MRFLCGSFLSTVWQNATSVLVTLSYVCVTAMPPACSPCASSAWPTQRQGKLSLTSWELGWTPLTWSWPPSAAGEWGVAVWAAPVLALSENVS